jgi:predicted LPLAT superfamily acyltransferase
MDRFVSPFVASIIWSHLADSGLLQTYLVQIVKHESTMSALATHADRAEWLTRPERGSMLLLRVMAGASRALGRARSRVLLYLIVIYFVLFAPTERRNARNYLRRALGREPKFSDHFRHVLYFATTIHDRVYLLHECFEQFAISIEGEELLRAVDATGNGAFLMGAHMGSFEVTRAIGMHRPGIQVVMAMYGDNARKIMTMLEALRPSVQPEIISLGRVEAMLKVRQRLEDGAFVGIMGDRTLGNEALQEVSFLGNRAYFPVGPMRAAALLGRPVIFMLGLYRGTNRYQLVFELVADFSTVGSSERAAAVADAIARYAALLEKYCHSDPYNWFNFFDFWRDADSRSPLPP